jgi:hypothetical protein
MSSAARVVTMLFVAATVGAQDARSILGDRVTTLTRSSKWTPVASIPVAFRTFHPQGMVKIGETFFVSSVEVIDRDAGKGVGHLFKIDKAGRLIADLRLGEGPIYHPGGIDYDGTSIWVPVAEYRPDSRAIIYRVDPAAMTAAEVFRVADHIGAIVHDTDAGTLHGVSWGSRRFYRWTVAGVAQGSMLNPSHYVDYQDCKYAGRARMLCTGVSEIRQTSGAAPFRLGGLDLVSLEDGRPLHQVPVLLWTADGLDMTHNPVWIEPGPAGLRAWFMPEDDRSTIHVFDVDVR